MPSAVVDVFNDSITFNSALLVEGNIEWVNRINEQLEMTQNYIYYLYIFIKNLQKASGGGNDSLAELARDQAYFDIDGPFRTWIAKINPETDDTETTIKAWDVQAKNILTDIADLYLENTGESAILGRNIVENKKQKFISAANAYAMFRASINKKNDYN